MASWAERYNRIRFEVAPYQGKFAMFRTRYLNDRLVYRTIVFVGADKSALERTAHAWQTTSACLSDMYA